MGREASDITGVRSGRLVAIKPSIVKGRERAWLCRCDCGNETLVARSKITSGHTQSCGCFRSEQTSKRFTKHGHSPRADAVTPTYRIWEGVLYRCKHHPEYAGRGIGVCDRWRDFRSFLADMGERPDGLTIERIDNDKGYEPGNCRWATYSDQNRNQRKRRPRKTRHGNGAFTDAQVLAIKADPRSGAAIARELGVTRRAINAIRRGDTYRHLLPVNVFD